MGKRKAKKNTDEKNIQKKNQHGDTGNEALKKSERVNPSKNDQQNIEASTSTKQQNKETSNTDESIRSGNEWHISNYKGNTSDVRRELFSPGSRRSDPVKRNKLDQEYRSYNYNETARQQTKDGRDATNVEKKYSHRRSQNRDPEFDLYEREFRSNTNLEFTKVTEIEGNLFDMEEDYSLAHCVAEDMNMGSGIAVQFRRDFKRVDELLNQRQYTGGLAILSQNQRFIYYLITKRYSNGKPTYETLFSSLQKLRKHIVENDVKKLAMPRIGCGLDRLQWEKVKCMIELIFKDVDVELVICNLQSSEDSPSLKHRNCKLTNVTYPIQDIEAETIIIYLSSEDGYVSQEMEALERKFNFLSRFRTLTKNLGNVVFFKENKDYLLCGCIVKKTKEDPIDFVSFQKCIRDIQSENKKHKFNYIGFQAMKDDEDTNNSKIINLLRNGMMRDVEVYVCWPGDLQNELAQRDRWSVNSTRPSIDKNTKSQDWRTPNTSNQSTSSQYSDQTASPHSARRANQYDSPKVKNDSSESRVDSGSGDSWFEKPNVKRDSRHKNTEILIQTGNNDNWFDSPKVKNESSESRVESGSRDSWFEKPNVKRDSWHKNTEIQIQTGNNANWFDNSTVHERNQNRKPALHENIADDPTSDEEFENFKRQCGTGGLLSISECPTSNVPKKCSQVFFTREDMMLESGIPLGISCKQFLGELLDQKQKAGGVAVAKSENNDLFCLVVTTPTTTPTSKTIFMSIKKLIDHVKKYNINKLLIQRNSSTFEWTEIEHMFQFLLKNLKVELLSQVVEGSSKIKTQSKLQHTKAGIHQTSRKSVIIYLASEDGQFSKEMDSLQQRFEFKGDFMKQPKKLGEVIIYKENEENVLYGCIAKKKITDEINFSMLQRCIAKVSDCNSKKEKLPNVGIQAVEDVDDSTNFKIMTVLTHYLENVTIKMCWPGKLKEKMPPKCA